MRLLQISILICTISSVFAQKQAVLDRQIYADFSKINAETYTYLYMCSKAEMYATQGNIEAEYTIRKSIVKTKEAKLADFERMQQSAIQVKQYKSAISYGLDIIRKFGETSESVYAVGNAHYLLANYPRAESYFKRAIELNASNFQALVRMGDIAVQETNIRKALQYFEAALAVNSNDIRVQRSYAIELGKSGSFSEAIKRLQSILDTNPSDVASLYYLALIYRQTSKQADACRYMTKANAIDPKIGKDELRAWECNK